MHLQKPPIASGSTLYLRQRSARMHWHTLAPKGLCKYAFPPMSLLAQTLCKIREDEEQFLLVALYCPNRTWFTELMLVATAPPPADSSEEGSGFLETGHPLAPASRFVETSCVVPGRDADVLGDLPQEVALRRHFRSTNHALSLGRLTPVQH